VGFASPFVVSADSSEKRRLAASWLGSVRCLCGATLKTLLALRQKKQALTMLAWYLTVRSAKVIVGVPISRKNILAITVRAFHKYDAHICVRVRPLATPGVFSRPGVITDGIRTRL